MIGAGIIPGRIIIKRKMLLNIIKYYLDLLSVKAFSNKYKRAKNEFLTPHTVREILKLL